ncbi:class I SAM-dependent methyltransferase [Segetibacter sp. 3557_3]|uniref:O-methyltransferase n=1 Tax=Segetibacter sp. 3557_3 TaxID=2547429 RepID=UPI0010589EB6|nr:class I SAM-dependent methyltransferase [Segetibacter sp. 3557_3]TDH21446.1 class I SAM-dependent methyltransferase [Segetibacter sp. 3557_3]
MFSAVQLGIKYLRYYITASNGKGHGVHSPFVFTFIQKILNDHTAYPAYRRIEQARRNLLNDPTVINVDDFGAGSVVAKTKSRSVAVIAGSSLKPAKYSQLLFRMVKYFKPRTIVELGTSLGITTAYLAAAGPSGVITFEGATEVAGIARQTLSACEVTNVQIVEGNFDDTLEPELLKLGSVDLAFIDGNHRKEPTLRYFHQLLSKADESSVFVFDDIHWSKEMEAAWKEIQHDPRVTLTIDLFFIGIVFFRKEQKARQHFSIRF